MSRFRLHVVLAVSGLLGVAVAGAATEWLLEIDPQASELRFTLGATLHTVNGKMAIERGTVRFDPEEGTISGEVVPDARSAETGHEGRDRDMHRKVLESERFTRIVLEPTRLEGELNLSGASRVEIEGNLAIHGAVQPVVVPVEVRIDGADVSAIATLRVPYVEWGMKDPSKLLLRVKKIVDVEVRLEGRLRSGTS